MSKDTSTVEPQTLSTDMETSSNVEPGNDSEHPCSTTQQHGSPGYPQWRIEEIRRKYSDRSSYMDWQDSYADQVSVSRRGEL